MKTNKNIVPFSNAITAYNNAIVKGEVVSDKVKTIYAKLVLDLKRTDWEWEYKEEKAQHIIQFIEKFCRHSKGKLGGQLIKLELWQKAMLSATFGFVSKKTGERKYREVILLVARKNGKSVLGSAVGLYGLTKDGEAGAEIVSIATKRDQAKVIWDEAKKMVAKSPPLRKRIRSLVGSLEYDTTESNFKPLSSDSNSLDGLNVHFCLVDELHAMKTKELYDVVIDGMGARDNPLSFVTSTMGTIRESIFDIKYLEIENIIYGCKKILSGEPCKIDERTLPIVYELDKKSEWTNEKCWKKANPGLGSIKNISTLRAKVEKAKIDSVNVKNLLTKDFNIRETSTESWLSYDDAYNNETFSLEDFRDSYCIGGVDLSSTTDLTAAVILMQHGGDDKIYMHSMYWIPEDVFLRRIETDKVPYDVWKDKGLLRTCKGNKINYKDVTKWFEEIQKEHGITVCWCGYDPWGSQYWIDDMNKLFNPAFKVMQEVRQGKKTESTPLKLLKSAFQRKEIVYNNNPIDLWNFTNASVDEDINSNIQLCHKVNRAKRMDGASALLDAYVVMLDKGEEYTNKISGK